MNERKFFGRSPWLQEDHDALVTMVRNQGVPISDVARILGRALSSCAGRLARTDDAGVFQSVADTQPMIWTPEQDSVVTAMLASGSTQRAIAERLGIRASQVGSRVRQLAWRGKESTPTIPAGGPAVRKCLMCGKDFHSSHSGNRRCVGCRERAAVWDTPFNPGIVGAM